jgi:hypothetical protein
VASNPGLAEALAPERLRKVLELAKNPELVLNPENSLLAEDADLAQHRKVGVGQSIR